MFKRILALMFCLSLFSLNSAFAAGREVIIKGKTGGRAEVTSGKLNVKATSSDSSDSTYYQDDADWTDGTSDHQLDGGIYQSTPQSITDGDTGPIQVDSHGNQKVVGDGTAGTAAGGVVTVQGVSSMTPVQVGDNSATLSVDDGAGALTVDQATPANLKSQIYGDDTTNPINTDSAGDLQIDINAGTAGSAAGSVLSVQGLASMTPVLVEGGIAEDAASTAKPIHVGVVAESTVPTEVADGDAIGFWADTFGRLIQKATDMATGTLLTSPQGRGAISSGYSQIIDETLDDSPTTITSSAFFIGDKNKVSFILKYNETEVGNTVSGTLTLEVSPDNSTWYDFDCIFDHSGVPVSSIVYTADAEDYFYLSESCTAQYIRATFAGTNTDTDDTIVIDVFLNWQK